MTALQIILGVIFALIGIWNVTELVTYRRGIPAILQVLFLSFFTTVYIIFCFEHNSIAAKTARVVDKVEEYKPIFDTLYKKVTDGRKN